MGQKATTSQQDFPSVPIGATSKPSQAITIKGGSASYTLVLNGPDMDKFSVQTAKCSIGMIRASHCDITPGAGSLPDVSLTVTFTPINTDSATAFIEAQDSAGVMTKLVTLTGEGYSEVATPGCGNSYSDCDLTSWGGITLLGGLEQSYLSSDSNQTNGFIRAFASAQLPHAWGFTHSLWGVIRDLGAPESNNNQNLVSAISNPDGTITTSSLSSVGYSLDFLVGYGAQHSVLGTQGRWSIGPIGAFGATTPLSSASASIGYVVPQLGTEECTQLQARFVGVMGYPADLVTGAPQGTTSATNPNCLFNKAGVPSGGTPAEVTTLAFTGANRSSFLEKWEIGGRSVYRSHETATQTTCDTSSACQRGVVDFTVGQDASITGGEMRHFVFKVDVVQPFPYSNGYFYIFGTTALRFERNTELPPLILAAANSAALQAIPSPNVFVEPLKQPNKDFYRIGVALSLDKIFTALSTTKH